MFRRSRLFGVFKLCTQYSGHLTEFWLISFWAEGSALASHLRWAFESLDNNEVSFDSKFFLYLRYIALRLHTNSNNKDSVYIAVCNLGRKRLPKPAIIQWFIWKRQGDTWLWKDIILQRESCSMSFTCKEMQCVWLSFASCKNIIPSLKIINLAVTL